ncbi:MAG: thiamine-phosphate kinase [Actinobacteria bacterium]|nr:thiamine-phosphate kinase [Actinomycetota bacterium]
MGHRESERIARLSRRFQPRGERLLRGIGDDAAVVRGDGVVVTSVDAVVEGVHFKSDYTPPRAAGHKAVASALSDLAAMGVPAGEIYVAAGLPGDFGDDDFEELAGGIEDVANTCDAVVAGGDLTASPVLWLSVTVIGHAVDEANVIGRDGASNGELLAVTGALGGSAAGLQLLLGSSAVVGISREQEQALRDRHLLPFPRFCAGRALATHGVTAMIDLSDGLARDAAQLAEASGLHARIELEDLPLAGGVAAVATLTGREPHKFAAESGEEYELLCSLPESAFAAARDAVRHCGGELTAIGRFDGELTKASPNGAGGAGAVDFLDRQGRTVVVAGYEHFD